MTDAYMCDMCGLLATGEPAGRFEWEIPNYAKQDDPLFAPDLPESRAADLCSECALELERVFGEATGP